MSFDVSALMGDKKLQVWVAYNDDMRVLVNHVDRQQFAAIMDQASKTILEAGQPRQEFDNILFGELLGMAAIADWEGPEADGKPVPCTEENKKLFMRKWMSFAKFISAICTDLERLVATRKEAARKNFESTSAPVPTTQE